MGDMVIAIIFEEPEDPVRLAKLIDRAQKYGRDIPNVKIKMTKGDAASTIRFFAENGELPVEMAPEQLEEINWVTHARRELALAGNDDDFNEAIVSAIKGFATYGHSGGSAPVGIHILEQLLQFKNLTPLTDDPSEWMQVDYGEDTCHQSRRCHEAFSNDGGKTYYLLSEGSSFTNPTHLHETAHKEL